MKQSKNISERIKLYHINLLRNKNKLQKNSKKLDKKSNNYVKKQSKLKIFFKFVIGFIAGFFEYLVMKSNRKNSNQLVESLTTQEKNSTDKDKVTNNIQEKLDKNSIEPIITLEPVKIDNNVIEKVNETNRKIEENNKTLTKKLDNYKSDFIMIENNELEHTKNQLILIEEQIIYADNYEELDMAKNKVLQTKKELQLKKSNNLIAVKNLEEDKQQVTQNTANDIIRNTYVEIKSNELPQEESNNNLISNEENVLEPIKYNQQLNEKNQTLITQNITKTEQSIIDSNKEIDKLIERCDEDLTLVEDKKEYIDLQEKYEEQLNSVEANSQDFKLTKKDLKQIKNNVKDILAQQQSNFNQLNRYMNMPHDSQMFIAKVSNFFRSTAKLSFSFVPFFVFPNKLFGLTTSAIMFNNSLKSYRMQPNTNYINQNIKMMVNNNELCLRVGINASEDALSEIDNIKYYLNNVPNEVKDTLEYRKYLVDVYSTEKIIKKQIETLQKMSKNYQDIKVKVKRRDY